MAQKRMQLRNTLAEMICRSILLRVTVLFRLEMLIDRDLAGQGPCFECVEGLKNIVPPDRDTPAVVLNVFCTSVCRQQAHPRILLTRVGSFG